jgi:hypothetical protein
MSEPLPEVAAGLVSVDELVAYMGHTQLTPTQRSAASRTLLGVQQELENHLNRPLQPVQVREVVVADWQGIGNLSITPVHKIISSTQITQQLPLLPAEPVVITPLTDQDVAREIDYTSGYDTTPGRIAGGWYLGVQNAYFLVEYIGGHIGYVPEGLKNDIKRVAAREIADNVDDTLSLRGDNAQQASEPDTRERGWTEDELRKWDRLRRRVIV